MKSPEITGNDQLVIDRFSICEAGYSVSNTTSIKIENSNDTPASNIFDNTSNSKELETSTSPIPAETISLEEKEENEFLDSTYREQVSKEIIQSIREKKLQGQEKIITSQDTKSSLSVKGEQGLIQELFTLEPSLQESQIIQNHVSEISETSGSGESNIDEAWQHLAQL
ncbi:8543_t:CDS:2, partial [Acaulospora morrowiae]